MSETMNPRELRQLAEDVGSGFAPRHLLVTAVIDILNETERLAHQPAETDGLTRLSHIARLLVEDEE